MQLSRNATYCDREETPHWGVRFGGILLLWWPGTVTARYRQRFWRRRHFSVGGRTEGDLPLSGAGKLWLLSILCLLFSVNALAENSSEESGWELSIANGLLLFKREKIVQSQGVDSNQERGHLQHPQTTEQPEVEADIVEEHWFMPAVESEFRSNVSGIVARSTVIQTFKNPGDEWLHGTYQFPLPEDAAVDVLKMRIGKREILGEIQRKQEARERFAKAKRAGQRASLVEQQKPNMFTTNLANIGPHEEIEIEIQFQQKARFVDGEFRLRFPTTFIPRAMLPGIKQESDVDINGTDSVDISDDAWSMFNSQFKADITLNAGSELAYIDTPHYPLVSVPSPQQASEFSYRLYLETPQPGVRDLEINWRYLAAAPQVLHYREANKAGEYGLVMILPGDAEQAPDTSREVTFVIDTSSSMAGQSIHQAKSALQLAVQSLHENDRFNIVEFNSEAYAFWDAAYQATDLNKSRAMNFIQNLTARGGTDIFAALQLSLDLQSDKVSPLLQQLVFVTDGAIGYEEQLLSEIELQLGDTRLFTVGIGSAPNTYFMVEAANVGRGTYTHISDVAQVNSRMSALLQQLSSPSLTNIEVDFGMEVEMFPARLPDLYHGEPLLLSYLAPQAISALQVQGLRGNSLWQQSQELEYLHEHSGIAKYWGQDKIRELSRQKRLIPAGGKEGQDAIIQRITEVALEHQLVSPYTSLIAVEQLVAKNQFSDGDPYGQRLQKEVLMASMPNTAAGSTQAFALALAALLIAAVMSLISWLKSRWTIAREASYLQRTCQQKIGQQRACQNRSGQVGGIYVS